MGAGVPHPETGEDGCLDASQPRKVSIWALRGGAARRERLDPRHAPGVLRCTRTVPRLPRGKPMSVDPFEDSGGNARQVGGVLDTGRLATVDGFKAAGVLAALGRLPDVRRERLIAAMLAPHEDLCGTGLAFGTAEAREVLGLLVRTQVRRS